MIIISWRISYITLQYVTFNSVSVVTNCESIVHCHMIYLSILLFGYVLWFLSLYCDLLSVIGYMSMSFLVRLYEDKLDLIRLAVNSGPSAYKKTAKVLSYVLFSKCNYDCFQPETPTLGGRGSCPSCPLSGGQREQAVLFTTGLFCRWLILWSITLC